MSKLKKDDVQISNEANAAKKAVRSDLQPTAKDGQHKNKNNKSKQLASKTNASSNLFTSMGFTVSHFKYGLFLVAVLAIGVFGGYVINNSQAEDSPQQSTVASTSASLYLMPASQNVSNNQSFNVSIKANSGDTNVNAVQASISYPTDLLEVTSISTNDSPYKMDVISTNTNGVVSIARGQIGGLTGDNLIANITFKSKKAGNATLKFVNETALVNSKTNQNIVTLTGNTKESSIIITQ